MFFRKNLISLHAVNWVNMFNVYLRANRNREPVHQLRGKWNHQAAAHKVSYFCHLIIMQTIIIFPLCEIISAYLIAVEA
jgi:hypothetical protein